MDRLSVECATDNIHRKKEIAVTKLENIPYSELEIGQTSRYQKTVLQDDIIMFAKLSGDLNPLHLDEEYARTTQFGGCIAHGMYTAAVMSAAMATKFPGPGSLYLSQTLKFRAPVRVGDILTVDSELIKKRDRNKSIVVSILVTNQDGQKVVSGEGIAQVPDEKVIVDIPDLPPITIG